MKKLVIGKTILFAIIMAYIFAFKFAFGDENILIPVMSITGVLMYLERDLTAEPIKNTLGFVLFYLLIGIATFISANSLILAIPVNLIVVFLISYTFCHTLKNPMYIPFTFLYLFLLAYPVPLKEMPLRLLALTVGAISIMVPQFFFNKNKVEKASKGIFIGMSGLMLQKISLIKDKKDFSNVDLQLDSLGRKLKNIIHDNKTDKFYLTTDGKISLDILVALEKINFLIDTSLFEKSDLLDDALAYINVFKETIETKDAKKSITTAKNLAEKYKNSKDVKEIQLLTSIIFMQTALNNKEQYNPTKKEVKHNIKGDIFGLKNISFNSIKLMYAIRISILVTIACFIMEYFKLNQGRWIMYTVLSLTTPIFELTKSKAKDRIISTIIGALFIAISFSIFKNTIIRSLIVLLAGYGNIYCKTYRQKIVFVTASAVGAAALISRPVLASGAIPTNPLILGLERIMFIIIGAILALIINTFLFKYDITKANKYLNDASDNLIKDLFKNIDKILDKGKLNDYINNVYVLLYQIDETIKNNNSLSEKKVDSEYQISVNEKFKLATTIYELNKLIQNISITSENEKKIQEFINTIEHSKVSLTENEISKKLESYNTIVSKVIFASLAEISNTKEEILNTYFSYKKEKLVFN